MLFSFISKIFNSFLLKVQSAELISDLPKQLTFINIWLLTSEYVKKVTILQLTVMNKLYLKLTGQIKKWLLLMYNIFWNIRYRFFKHFGNSRNVELSDLFHMSELSQAESVESRFGPSFLEQSEITRHAKA